MDIRLETLVPITVRIKFGITTALGTANKAISNRTAEDRMGRDPEQPLQAKDRDTPKDPVDRKEIAGHVALPITIHNTAPKLPRHLRPSVTERIHPEEDEETKLPLISITTKMGQVYDSPRPNMDRAIRAPHPHV